MKKINSFSTIYMIAIFTFIQFAGKAQSISLSPYGGICMDQEGIIRPDIMGGLTALFKPGPATSMFSLGLDMSGGQRYRYQTNIRTLDLKKDSLVWRSTNAPSVMFWGTIDIPDGGDEEDGRSNPFAGPVVIFGYGLAFTDISSAPANVLKISLQGNYAIKQGKVRISTFLRPSLNILYAGDILESWDMSAGLIFTLGRGSSDGGDY